MSSSALFFGAFFAVADVEVLGLDVFFKGRSASRERRLPPICLQPPSSAAFLFDFVTGGIDSPRPLLHPFLRSNVSSGTAACAFLALAGRTLPAGRILPPADDDLPFPFWPADRLLDRENGLASGTMAVSLRVLRSSCLFKCDERCRAEVAWSSSSVSGLSWDTGLDGGEGEDDRKDLDHFRAPMLAPAELAITVSDP